MRLGTREDHSWRTRRSTQRRARGSALALDRACSRCARRPGSRFQAQQHLGQSLPPAPCHPHSRAPHRVVELGDGRHDGVVVLAPVHLRAASLQLVPPVRGTHGCSGALEQLLLQLIEPGAAVGSQEQCLYSRRGTLRMWRLPAGLQSSAPPVERDQLADSSPYDSAPLGQPATPTSGRVAGGRRGIWKLGLGSGNLLVRVFPAGSEGLACPARAHLTQTRRRHHPSLCAKVPEVPPAKI